MSTKYCLKNLLKFIDVLQSNSSNLLFENFGCSKNFLGPSFSCYCYNTRVITLYTKDGTILSSQYDEANSSEYFRICKVNDDCCTLLVLKRNEDSYISTNQYITVNLKCIFAVKCVADTNVTL